jgi:hypothetical protein
MTNDELTKVMERAMEHEFTKFFGVFVSNLCTESAESAERKLTKGLHTLKDARQRAEKVIKEMDIVS